jgi:hypothetical protein
MLIESRDHQGRATGGQLRFFGKLTRGIHSNFGDWHAVCIPLLLKAVEYIMAPLSITQVKNLDNCSQCGSDLSCAFFLLA